LEGTPQLEAFPELGAHEGMQRFLQQPAAQEVDARSPQLPGAGGGQDELRGRARPAFDEQVHDVQQERGLLDFVDDDLAGVRLAFDSIAEPLGARQQRPERLRIEQVDVDGLRIGAAQPGRLAAPPGAEQEEALARWREQPGNQVRLLRSLALITHALHLAVISSDVKAIFAAFSATLPLFYRLLDRCT